MLGVTSAPRPPGFPSHWSLLTGSYWGVSRESLGTLLHPRGRSLGWQGRAGRGL